MCSHCSLIINHAMFKFGLEDTATFIIRHIRYLIGSDCQISFDPVQIQSMIVESSTLQIQRHGYSGDLKIVICVGICTLPFYAINMDVVSLFTYSSF
ncbi:transmembrane protein, putative [Medicago truncatula]|uniref:Transmembrane protein, putative n=1 Tax=Medicago truncatula TaxID=3880 RepID=G7IBT8_MEDTR|nr:transmembrane protein, putative [Medicago truncatula]